MCEQMLVKSVVLAPGHPNSHAYTLFPRPTWARATRTSPDRLTRRWDRSRSSASPVRTFAPAWQCPSSCNRCCGRGIPLQHVRHQIYFCNIQMKHLQHMLETAETLAKHLKTLEKHMYSSCKHMQHPDETLETYATCMYMQRWNTCNICLKQMKHLHIHLKHHCNMCNITIYFCNIDIKHLQRTYETYLKHLK